MGQHNPLSRRNPIRPNKRQTVSDIHLHRNNKGILFLATIDNSRNLLVSALTSRRDPMRPINNPHRRTVNNDRWQRIIQLGQNLCMTTVRARPPWRITRQQRVDPHGPSWTTSQLASEPSISSHSALIMNHHDRTI